MNKIKILLTLTVLFISTLSYSQNVGIGTTTPDTNAILDLTATNKGILVPRLTTAQRTAAPFLAGLRATQKRTNGIFFIEDVDSYLT